MKLLLDNNLSPKLVTRLGDIFPFMSHVISHALDKASDLEVWHYAQEQDFCLVTKDADFNDLLTIYGFPPKIIWIRRGNCTTHAIDRLLRDHLAAIASFLEDESLGLLELY
jgi:predicted nuclease of predicted toxin-antitoxin system